VGVQAEKKAPRKEVIKLPWEPLTPFSEVLKSLPNRQNGTVDEEEDDDELEAYEDSLQRLRVGHGFGLWLVHTQS
jgi:hypothetical protein